MSDENQQLRQQLNQSMSELNGSQQQFAAYYYMDAWLSSFYQNYTNMYVTIEPSLFTPPISADQAIELVLHYGGWNSSSLQNTAVLVRFGTTSFEPYQTYHDVNVTVGPINSYAPFQEGNITYRYVWAVQISQLQISPPTYSEQFPYHYYLVDSSTGEVFNASGLGWTGTVTETNYSPNPYIHWPAATPLSIDSYQIVNNSEMVVQVRDVGAYNLTVDSVNVDGIEAIINPNNLSLGSGQVASCTITAMSNGTTWADGSIHVLQLASTSSQAFIGIEIKK